MEKIWYIIIEEKEEGPFSSKDLLFDNRVTLDTLVWKEGFGSWVPLRMVEELKELFDEEVQPLKEEKDEKESNGLASVDELVLDYSRDPNFLLLWLIILLIIVCYVYFELFGLA